MVTNDKLVDVLEEILEKNRDAEKGYKKAAENAGSVSLTDYFERKASERAAFCTELKRELVTAYDDFDDEGSFTGTIHRSWMDIKSFFSGDQDEAMLEEAIKGDKAAVAEYEDVLNDNSLPMGIATVIGDQKMKIQADLNKIKFLEDLH